ncbi:MAG: hypothetical protein JWN03_2778 [Nocardia sp.]|nr:hypothetical protein [Nocardia sp.]
MPVGVSTRQVLPAMFVQLNAHDCNGLRHSWIDLIVPSRVHAEMTVPQAREVAAALIAGADCWDARMPAGALLQPHSCPLWCKQHEEARAVDPLVDRWHYGCARVVPVTGPWLSGTEVRVRLCAKDSGLGRRVVIGLIVQDDDTPELTAAEARRMAAALLDAADEIAGAR